MLNAGAVGGDLVAARSPLSGEQLVASADELQRRKRVPGASPGPALSFDPFLLPRKPGGAECRPSSWTPGASQCFRRARR